MHTTYSGYAGLTTFKILYKFNWLDSRIWTSVWVRYPANVSRVVDWHLWRRLVSWSSACPLWVSVWHGVCILYLT